jgi:hypothetical protein
MFNVCFIKTSYFFQLLMQLLGTLPIYIFILSFIQLGFFIVLEGHLIRAFISVLLDYIKLSYSYILFVIFLVVGFFYTNFNAFGDIYQDRVYCYIIK